MTQPRQGHESRVRRHQFPITSKSPGVTDLPSEETGVGLGRTGDGRVIGVVPCGREDVPREVVGPSTRSSGRIVQRRRVVKGLNGRESTSEGEDEGTRWSGGPVCGTVSKPKETCKEFMLC